MGVVAPTFYGTVEGYKDGEVCVFKGVPYAVPPVDNRRWEHPEPPAPWEGVRKAESWACRSLQSPNTFDQLIGGAAPTDGESEDCLYVNVWTPEIDDKHRPVMVWIHGGIFVMGAGSQEGYDGKNLAQEGDVVVVTLNYRLGALGFLRLNELTEGEIPSTGNEGLLDQIEALAWVRDNIAGFGGDPDNVTIFGESAGAMSIGALLSMPSAKGLFHKAILQSGAAHLGISKEGSVQVARDFVDQLSVPIDKIRTCSADQIIKAQEVLREKGPGNPPAPFRPVLDGELLPDVPVFEIRKGSAKGIPLLVGTTLDEMQLFLMAVASLNDMTKEKLQENVTNWAGDKAEELISTYRSFLESRNKNASPKEIYIAIMTDRTFRAPAIALLEAQKPFEDRVYNYLFELESPLAEGAMGSCHLMEIGFVFGTWDKAPDFYGKGEKLQQLASRTIALWASFARTGVPSADGIGEIPAYDTDKRQTLVLNEKTEIKSAPWEETRAMMASLGDKALVRGKIQGIFFKKNVLKEKL